jgi:hypothetical protein
MAYIDREELAARDRERMNAKILATLAPDALRKGSGKRGGGAAQGKRKPKRL